MVKDTYYFSHDYNARNDKKISALVRDFKSSGYGIFWATCEMMHEEGGELEFDDLTIHAIAKDINESSELVQEVLDKCVDKYRLFTKQNEAERSSASVLRSSRIHRNLEEKNSKKISKVEAGRKGGLKSGESRNYKKENEAKRSSASSNEPKERKGKERKDIIKGVPVCGFNTKPKPSDFNGLPQQTLDQASELIFTTKRVKVSSEDLKKMWEVFKVQSLTGEEYYANEGKVYSHYLNWVKKQDFKEVTGTNKNSWM